MAPSAHRWSFGLAAVIIVRASGVLADEVRALPAAAPSGRLSFGLGYLGQSAAHPGGLGWAQVRLSGFGPAHELFGRLSLGGYVHPRNHVGLLGSVELGYRLSGPTGLFGELAVGAGYLHTLLASPVYQPAADGSVSKVADPGRSSFLPSASLGVGWDFRVRTKWPLSIALRQQVALQTPFNATSVLRFLTILGVAYAL